MTVATYVCPKCEKRVTDRGEAGAKFSPTVKCGRCGGAMALASKREIVAKKDRR